MHGWEVVPPYTEVKQINFLLRNTLKDNSNIFHQTFQVKLEAYSGESGLEMVQKWMKAVAHCPFGIPSEEGGENV